MADDRSRTSPNIYSRLNDSQPSIHSPHQEPERPVASEVDSIVEIDFSQDEILLGIYNDMDFWNIQGLDQVESGVGTLFDATEYENAEDRQASDTLPLDNNSLMNLLEAETEYPQATIEWKGSRDRDRNQGLEKP
jgi:hypothetical protein